MLRKMLLCTKFNLAPNTSHLLVSAVCTVPFDSNESRLHKRRARCNL